MMVDSILRHFPQIPADEPDQEIQLARKHALRERSGATGKMRVLNS
jgi:hypothetical protein